MRKRTVGVWLDARIQSVQYQSSDWWGEEGEWWLHDAVKWRCGNSFNSTINCSDRWVRERVSATSDDGRSAVIPCNSAASAPERGAAPCPPSFIISAGGSA